MECSGKSYGVSANGVSVTSVDGVSVTSANGVSVTSAISYIQLLLSLHLSHGLIVVNQGRTNETRSPAP
jgi:hypothetical protein